MSNPPAKKTAAAKKAAAQPPKADADQVDDTPDPVDHVDDGGRVVTVKGHEYKIGAEAFDDFELLDDLAHLDITRMPSVLRRLLGPDQTKEALERLRDPKLGRVTLDAGEDFVADLLECFNPN